MRSPEVSRPRTRCPFRDGCLSDEVLGGRFEPIGDAFELLGVELVKGIEEEAKRAGGEANPEVASRVRSGVWLPVVAEPIVVDSAKDGFGIVHRTVVDHVDLDVRVKLIECGHAGAAIPRAEPRPLRAVTLRRMAGDSQPRRLYRAPTRL